MRYIAGSRSLKVSRHLPRSFVGGGGRALYHFVFLSQVASLLHDSMNCALKRKTRLFGAVNLVILYEILNIVPRPFLAVVGVEIGMKIHAAISIIWWGCLRGVHVTRSPRSRGLA